MHGGQHRYRLGDGPYVRNQPPRHLSQVTREANASYRPIPLLWSVQINRNTKISIIGLMGLGVLFVPLNVSDTPAGFWLTFRFLRSASLSACVRLKYTVSLTSEQDYMHGVANVVIWGFAENGMGMVVGNAATLRPLFSVLLDRKNSEYLKYHNSGGPSGSHHNTGAFSRSYELDEKKTHLTTASAVGKHRNGSLSDGGSQSEILDNTQRPGQADIVVSREVRVAYD